MSEPRADSERPAAGGREADGRAQITHSWAVVAGAVHVGLALGSR